MTAAGARRDGADARRFAMVCDRFARARDRCGSADMRFRFATYDLQLFVVGGALTHAVYGLSSPLLTASTGDDQGPISADSVNSPVDADYPPGGSRRRARICAPPRAATFRPCPFRAASTP